MKNLVRLFCFLFWLGVIVWACIILTGCTTVIKSDKIVSIKQRTFGINVGTDPVNQTPRIQLGLVTTVWQMIPTSRTGQIYAPRYFDTFELGQSGNPFRSEIRENTGTGDVAVYTNATGGAIIPKVPIPGSPVEPFKPE